MSSFRLRFSRQWAFERGVPYLLAVVLMAVALRQGIGATRDLTWPYDTDHFRDLAYTARVLQGEWQADGFYRGETLWYNPLVPWLVAGISAVSHSPAHVVFARSGAYLNMVGPAAFFVMVGVLFDWWIAAAVVALPLLWSVAGRYHLHVLNSCAADWVYELLQPSELGTLLRSSLTVGAALSATGLVWLLMRRRTNGFDRTIALWTVVNVAWLAYGYAATLVLPMGIHAAVVPSFHFLFYWRALAAVWAGVGAVAIMRRCTAHTRPVFGTAVLAGCIVVGTLILTPSYRQRFDFTTARDAALGRGRNTSWVQAFEWIRLRTDAGAVFLAPDDQGQFVIGPAGRGVVVVDACQSNPYVDYGVRASARADMYSALAAGDPSRFCVRATENGVTHVVLTANEEQRIALQGPRILSPAFRFGDFRIWRVSGCAGR